MTQKTISLVDSISEHLDQYFRLYGNTLPEDGLYDRIIQTVEQCLFEKTLKAVSYNQLKASALLGIHRNTLSKKMSLYGITDSPAIAERKGKSKR